MDEVPPRDGQHIPGLDGVRALCVTGVLCLHLQYGYRLWPNEWLGKLFMRGWYGVDIFFVLSGFLITWILLAEYEKTGTIQLGRFYRRRALRLMPAYTSAIILTLVQKRISDPASYHQMLSALPFFLTYTLNGAVAAGWFPFVPLGIAWSLCIEEQFYFFWPWLLRRIGANHATTFAALSIAIVCVYRSGIYTWLNWGRLSAPTEASILRIYMATDTRIDVIFTGCLIALLFRKPAWQPVWSFLSGRKATWMLIFIFVALITWGTAGTPSYGSAKVATIGYTLMAMATGSLLMAILLRPESKLLRWLSFPPLVFVGRVSYGFYLFHLLAAGLVVRALHLSPASLGVIKFLGVILAWLGSLTLATLHYFGVEKRFLRLR